MTASTAAVQSALPTIGRGGVVPYIAVWSGEQSLPTRLVSRRGLGIGYADELLTDRDEDGVLWSRMESKPGQGKPIYRQLHPLRQRRAMRRLSCQVCGGVADYTAEGHLWLLPDQIEKWDGWPEEVENPFPPLCLACARLSVRQCPPLRRGFVAVRAHSTVCGVTGVLYRDGGGFPVISEQDDGAVVSYTDPAIRWMQATQLNRSLHDCKIIDSERLLL